MKLFVFLAVPLVAALLARPANACGCLPQTGAQEALKNSSYVMLVDILEKTRVALPEIDPEYKEFKIKVRVREYWKGNAKRTMFVRTPAAAEECGMDLVVGKRYLMYAVGSTMPLVLTCSRTVPADHLQARADMERFGDGTKPKEQE